MYKPTREDMELPFQGYIESKIKIELLDYNFKTIATLQDALISDSCSIDADSDIRRTYEGTFYLKDPTFFIGENKKIWTDKYIRVWRGKKNNKTGKTVWYNIGVYLFNDTSYTYDETKKQLTISCVDLMSRLNNTISGQIAGAFSFQIPHEQTVIEEVKRYGGVQTVKNKGSVINTRISIGTSLSFSLISPHTSRHDYYKLLQIEIRVKGVSVYDTNWNTVTDDNMRLRLSIDDSVKTSDIDDKNETAFIIDSLKENQTLSVGFLQNVSITRISIYFKYIETESPITIEGTLTQPAKFNEVIHWGFSDSSFLGECPVPDYMIAGNSTEIIRQEIKDKTSNEKKYNTLTINTGERTVTDTVTKPTSWYNTVIDTIKKSSVVSDYIVEYTDAVIPYDLEFQTGASVYDILRELVDLMVNWEMFFDTRGTLRIQPVPTLYEDDVLLDGEYLKPLIISETNKDSFSNVRNITEIWGASLDASYYTDKCERTETGYTITFDDLLFTDERKISNNTILAVKIDKPNMENPQITIVGKYNDVTVETPNQETVTLSPIPLYTSSGDFFDRNLLKENITYCIKYYKGKLYYLGQFQVHGMCIETIKEPSGEDKNKLSEKYNCQNIYYSVEPSSPYCVEKIGERIQVLSGDDYDNIYSDELAVERAKWENWKKTRRQETISIDMIDIPWLDVNQKIEYTSHIDGKTGQYIVKSVTSGTSEGTMSVELMRFYPLYILDAKRYEAVTELKEYRKILTEKYIYSENNFNLLEKHVSDGTAEIYAADSTDDVKTLLVSYKKKLNNIDREN